MEKHLPWLQKKWKKYSTSIHESVEQHCTIIAVEEILNRQDDIASVLEGHRFPHQSISETGHGSMQDGTNGTYYHIPSESPSSVSFLLLLVASKCRL